MITNRFYEGDDTLVSPADGLKTPQHTPSGRSVISAAGRISGRGKAVIENVHSQLSLFSFLQSTKKVIY
ncbi:MAG: hypothetical protein KQH63_02190 [Desulfobulbaceae bacterium]|nr:hypothetical protein [Desulfobulbaceae bacterium]